MNKNLGIKGEKLAAELVESEGYKLIMANYICRLGEIDLIARDNDTLVFIEVRTRKSDKFGLPQETVNLKKQKKIRQVAQYYLKYNNLSGVKCRFDVVGIVWKEGQKPKAELIKDAF